MAIDGVSEAIGELKALMTGQTEMLAEVRRLAIETNGRVGRLETRADSIEKVVLVHEQELAIMRQAREDRDAVMRFVRSWKGRASLLTAGLVALVTPVVTMAVTLVKNL